MQEAVLLSIIIPIYNEEKNIEALYNRVIAVLEEHTLNAEIIYINDGSVDGSLRVLKGLANTDSRVCFIDLSRNFGHQVAIFAGIEMARGKDLIIMDGDGQDPPELIPQMLRKRSEGYDVVYAKRLKRQGESWLKKATAHVFYRTLKAITNINIPLDTGDFRLISSRVQQVLVSIREQNKFISGQISWIGFNQTYVEYEREERLAGETNFTYKTMMKFALDGITSFSLWPLKVATIMGFFVSIISFVLIIYTIYQKLWGTTVPGWASTNISILFIGGIQLIGIGILGEYIGRMNDNVKNRPYYIVKETNIE